MQLSKTWEDTSRVARATGTWRRLLGGLVSSTNVTFTFARSSRAETGVDRALAAGTIAAIAMLYPRVLVATAILNPAVVSPLLRFLGPPALVAALLAAVGAIRGTSVATTEVPQRNPPPVAGKPGRRR
jgi:uncharacterized membrane protein (DUF4010 family)